MASTEKMAADPAREDMLILVDGLDRETGTATKLETHTGGLLHRALSVVLTREGSSGPEVLLTKRAMGKYHSGGLWTNSCCSHPRAGETTLDAASRRTLEELGCTAVDLEEIGAFAYRAAFADGIVEFEYDHVFLGSVGGTLSPDPAETSETRWVAVADLAQELAQMPEHFTAWAPMVLSMAIAQL